MRLRAQGIDDDNVIVDRVRQAHGLSNGQGGVGREQGMHDASEVLEKTTEASRIQGRQQRPRHRDDGPEELATTTEASAEEDEPGVSTTRTEAPAEEVEETTRLS